MCGNDDPTQPKINLLNHFLKSKKDVDSPWEEGSPSAEVAYGLSFQPNSTQEKGQALGKYVLIGVGDGSRGRAEFILGVLRWEGSPCDFRVAESVSLQSPPRFYKSLLRSYCVSCSVL